MNGITTVISKQSHLYVGGFSVHLRKGASCPKIDHIDLEIEPESANVQPAFRARVSPSDTPAAQKALTANSSLVWSVQMASAVVASEGASFRVAHRSTAPRQ